MDYNTLSDKELSVLWRRHYPQGHGCQAAFAENYTINRGNFSNWLNGKRESNASRNAVIRYLTNNGDEPSTFSRTAPISPTNIKSRTSLSNDDTHLEVPLTCKYYLRGHCRLGVACQFSHTDNSKPQQEKHVGARETYVNAVKSVREKLCSMRNLRTVLFVDYDNYTWHVDDFNTDGMYCGCFALLFLSPLNRCAVPNLGSRVAMFRSLTTSKNAVDQDISMEAFLLDYLIPDKSVEFALLTSDWFSVEVVERLRYFGRTCNTYTPSNPWHNDPPDGDKGKADDATITVLSGRMKELLTRQPGITA